MTLKPALFIAFLVLTATMFCQEKDSVAELNKARQDTIRYGTDAEILSLIDALQNEKNATLDSELVEILATARSTKLMDGIFSYLQKYKKTGGEERALDVLENRDREENSTIDSAITYLASVKYPPAAALFRDILDAEEERFSAYAVRGLGACGGFDDAAYLVDYLKKRDPPEEVISAIIVALGDLKAPSATAYLLDILKDPDTKIGRKTRAIESLGKIGDKTALDTLLATMEDSDANVRLFALNAVAEFDGKEADAAIVESFRDSFYKVRLAAAKAAGKRKLAEAIPFLSYRAERDEVVTVREESLAALGQFGSKKAFESVYKVFAERKTPDRIRIAAAGALAAGDPGTYAKPLVEEMTQAKKDKKTVLYHGFAKAIASAKSDALEEQARNFLSSKDIIDKHYGLDLALINNFRSLEGLIRPLADDANASLARKARQFLGE